MKTYWCRKEATILFIFVSHLIIPHSLKIIVKFTFRQFRLYDTRQKLQVNALLKIFHSNWSNLDIDPSTDIRCITLSLLPAHLAQVYLK